MTEEKIYTVSEVADILRLHVDSVKRKLRAGEIVGFRLGERGDWRVRKSDLDDFTKRYKRGNRR